MPQIRAWLSCRRILLQSLGGLAGLICSVCCGGPDQIVVGSVRWGFDGTIQERCFLPVTIELQNTSSTPWSGELELWQGIGRSNRVTPRWIEEVALQGNETRWVQFVPYLDYAGAPWSVRWGPGPLQQTELPVVQSGSRPTVLLVNDGATTAVNSPLRRMPAEQFPNFATATDALRGVIIDQPPHWHGGRVNAFTTWLQQGGTVYLLKDSTGRYPTFPANLAVLNSREDQFPVGQGQVIRIDRTTREVDLPFARSRLFKEEKPEGIPANRFPEPSQMSGPSPLVTWSQNGQLFRQLMPLVTFHRPWPLIYVVIFCYLLVLYPFCWRLGKNQRLSIFYAFFFGSAILFTTVFGLLGRLGSSTRNRIRTATLAHRIEPSSWKLTQWSQIGVAHAGWNSYSDPGSGHCYGIIEVNEVAEVCFYGGRTSRVDLRLPTGSYQSILHQAQIGGEAAQPSVVEFRTEEGKLQTLLISVSDCFSTPVIRAAAVFSGRVYPLELKDDSLQLPAKKVNFGLASLLEDETRTDMQRGFRLTELSAWNKLAAKVPGAEGYGEMFIPLLGNSFGLTDMIDLRKLALPSSTLRLAVQTFLPDNFKAASDGFPDQAGTVLFVYDLNVTGP
ncbi:hypothetical protein [Planctomicrobium sp. SH664]|uniref:hypothetical protein n=1 Tax=Planctomicrobium sp. SH664 TaxID=3448125 RepID=UPI003F5AE163